MLTKLQLSFGIFLLIIYILEEYDEKAWTKKTKRGELKIDENGLIVKIGKTIYTAFGYFSNSSKQTAKDKIERIIKKEGGKNQ